MSRSSPVYVTDGLLSSVRAKKPFTFGVKGTVDGEPEATRGHKLDITFPSGPRAVLPAKVKDNLKVKGAWIVEALLPGDGDYVMVIKVDGKEITGSPFNVKAEYEHYEMLIYPMKYLEAILISSFNSSNIASSNPASPMVPAASSVLNSSAAFENSAASPSHPPSSPGSALGKDPDQQPSQLAPLSEEVSVGRLNSSATSSPSVALRNVRGRQVKFFIRFVLFFVFVFFFSNRSILNK